MNTSQQQQTKSLNIFKILHEAFKLPIKNCILTIPILIFSFLSNSLILYLFFLSSTPLLTDLVTNSSISFLDEKTPNYDSPIKDLKELIIVDFIFLTVSFIISALIEIATIHVLTLTYSGTNISTLKEVFYKFSKKWKGPMVTYIYIALLLLGYIFLLVVTVKIFMFITRGYLVLIVGGVILCLLGVAFSLHLTMVCLMSLVVSVVEEGCYGLEAMSKAGKIIKGRRIQGTLLILIVFIVMNMITAICKFVRGYVVNSTIVSQLVMGMVYVVGVVVKDMYEWAVSIVFYYDCKGSNDDDGSMYVSLPNADQDEAQSP